MIYRILRKGEVRVNKKRIKPEYKLEAGDEVRIPPVRIAEREEEAVSPHLQKVAALADVILYEDDHILVLNKTFRYGGTWRQWFKLRRYRRFAGVAPGSAVP